MPDHHAANRANEAFDRLLLKVHALGKEVLSVHAAEVDRNARFPAESIDALRQARLLSAYVPREYGGMGLNVVQIAQLCEALASIAAHRR